MNKQHVVKAKRCSSLSSKGLHPRSENHTIGSTIIEEHDSSAQQEPHLYKEKEVERITANKKVTGFLLAESLTRKKLVLSYSCWV